MKTHSRGPGGLLLRALAALPLALILTCAPSLGHSWTQVNASGSAPDSVGLMLLLPDGTVLAEEPDTSSWYLLSPDSSGHYFDGTWTALSPMNDTRLYFGSQVLPTGQVFVAGGEYGTGGSTAELYTPTADPLNPWHGTTAANPWAYIDPPTSLLNPSDASPVTGGDEAFIDTTSEILPGGVVLIAPVAPAVYGGTLIYDPSTNSWAYGGTLANGTAYQDEASWVKLPDNSIVTVDPFGQDSERFIPAASGTSGSWNSDAEVPVPIFDTEDYEEGGATLLPNGKAFFQGGTGNTVIYTPSGSASNGSWVQGPDIPQSLSPEDAPIAMMPNGKFLCVEGPKAQSSNSYPSPSSFFEYDYTAGASGSFTEVGAPYGSDGGPNHLPQAPNPTYYFNFLTLPDGTVLCSNFSSTTYIYNPDPNTNALVSSLVPTISNVTQNVDGSYTLTGTLVNGISEGANYGDDGQMASNYPIVFLQSGNNVYYARTYNWSSTGVRQTSKMVSTQFILPPSLPSGSYSLIVSANGLQSAPYAFSTSVINAIVWVDFSAAGGGVGTFADPYNTFADGVSGVSGGGTVEIEGGGSSPETLTVSKPMTVLAYNGPVTIGAAPGPAQTAGAANAALTAAEARVQAATAARAAGSAEPAPPHHISVVRQ